MTALSITSPTSYLDRAMSALRTIGIQFPKDGAPVLALLDQVSKYDPARVTAIADVLQQSSTFNAAVRQEIKGMDISTRYADITTEFNSIRNDALEMSQWMNDGRLDLAEKVKLNWMKLRRGSIPDRFEKIKKTYETVNASAKDQIERENTILQAYVDFRMALKGAEVEAQEVLKIAQAALDDCKRRLAAASEAVAGYGGQDEAQRSRLEMARDELVREVQAEDKHFQIAKDIADDLKTSYNTAELVFARLQQTHTVKERLHERAITFFSTNEVVFTGLAASFTSMAGLGEATNTLEAMKDGMSQGIEALAKTGGQQLERGLKAGYGSTIKAESVRSLAESIVEFQASSLKMVEELRRESTLASREIEAAAEDGKRRFAALIAQGA